MANTFGHLFRITTFGESHGGGVGVIVDGCPPRLPLDLEAIQHQLTRRRPGQSHLTTARNEADQVEVLSGMFEGVTLGSPLAMLVRNKDARSDDYNTFKDTYRPSHADYTYDAKYGIRNWKGGGRTSARETIGRVAGGAVAATLLHKITNTEIVAWVESIHDIGVPADGVDLASVNEDQVDAHLTRCPHAETADAMQKRIEEIKADGDSIGGVIRCIARNVPPGWGEPVFDRLEADLAKAMLSLPATKGFEIGSGFGGTLMKGSEHNDPFALDDSGNTPANNSNAPRVVTSSNHSGGVQGGITNGAMIDFRVAFKPTSTIFKEQQTVTKQGDEVAFIPKGRHDPCVLPRAVPMVEAMAALVLADHALRHQALAGTFHPSDSPTEAATS
jgi:chorismate synthase